MEKIKRDGKHCGKSLNRLVSRCRREAKRAASVILCITLIMCNLANVVVASDGSDGERFGLTRASLYDALQKAVAEEQILDEEQNLKGEDAEDYRELLTGWTEDGRPLYELKPEYEEQNSKLKLRVFARLSSEIPVDAAYEMDGTEEFIFLLINDTKDEQSAVIRVDDRQTERISILSARAIPVDNESDPKSSAADFGSADAEIASPSDSETVTGPAAKPDAEALESTPSDAEPATPSDATPSDATPSDAEWEQLTGDIYGAVRFNGDGAVAFVTEAENLGMSEEDFFQWAAGAKELDIYTAELDNVIVEVKARKGDIPKEAELFVAELKEDDAETADQFQTAKTELDAAGVQYDGMMALDICFKAVDEYGENYEIEPEHGVSVSLKVKQGALPTDIDAETLEVQHHAETTEGVVVEKVAAKTEGTVEILGKLDKAESQQIEAANTENENTVEVKDTEISNEEESAENLLERISDAIDSIGFEDEAAVVAEFAVDGFSRFTITWQGWQKTRKLNVKYVDWSTKNEITLSGIQENFTINGSKIYSVETWDPKDPDWVYKESWLDYNDTSNRQPVKYVMINNGTKGWKYSFDGKNWKDNPYLKGEDNGTIWMFFEYKGPSVPIVDTVDSVEKGITINAYNYNKKINDKHVFKFNGGGEENDPSFNKNSGTVTKNILADQFGEDGYPKLNKSTTQVGESLQYLFGKESTDGKTVYSDRNHLFIQDEYDKTGYFEYDSSKNFATLRDKDTISKDFKVYNQSTDDLAKFMPFNDIIPGGDIVGTKDFHFGLNIGFNFVQPAGGMIDGKPMVFEFTGDDDLWVFIDGKLVLDIGGIHPAISGSINFSTGDITVAGTTAKNLGDILTPKANGNTLKDYHNYRVEIFYLERGEGASNCKIRFNIPPTKPGTVYVRKDVTNVTNSPEYIDSDFNFKVEINKWNSDQNVYEGYKPYSGSYQVYEGQIGTGKPIGSPKNTVDGKFILKRNQYAEFTEDISDMDQYCVYEYIPDTSGIENKYDLVVSGTQVQTVDVKDGTTGESYRGYMVKDIPVNQQAAVFENSCVVENLYNLEIKKELQEGDEDSGRSYNIDVKLGGIPYKGMYDIVNAEGSFVKTEQAAGKVCITAGQKAIIHGVVWGSSFEVNEDKAQLGQEYVDPVYEIKNAVDVNTNKCASGKIPMDTSDTALSQGKVTSVIVRNAKKPSVKITKKVMGNFGDQSKAFDFKIVVTNADGTAYQNLAGTYGDIEVNTDGDFQLKHNQTLIIPNLPMGATVKVSETPVLSADGKKNEYQTSVIVGNETEKKTTEVTINPLIKTTEICFINKKERDVVDTGILLDSMPYILILAVVGLGIGGYIIRKRKKDESDLD